MTDAPLSRAKYNELVQLLQRAGDEWVQPGPGMSDDDVAEGFRNLTHILQSALYSHQEFDPERPVFNRIVSLKDSWAVKPAKGGGK